MILTLNRRAALAEAATLAAAGLAVPRMPGGSPGMEADGQEPYEVILFRKDGTREVFARYA